MPMRLSWSALKLAMPLFFPTTIAMPPLQVGATMTTGSPAAAPSVAAARP